MDGGFCRVYLAHSHVHSLILYLAAWCYKGSLALQKLLAQKT